MANGACSDRTPQIKDHAVTVGHVGHNADGAVLRIELRFFNSFHRYNPGEGVVHKFKVGEGATVGDLVTCLPIPQSENLLVLRNGRDVSPGLYALGQINLNALIETAT